MINSRTVSTEASGREQELAASLNKDSLTPDDLEVEAAAHPEGRKRGGTVSLYVRDGAQVFYDEIAEEWVGYNDSDDDE